MGLRSTAALTAGAKVAPRLTAGYVRTILDKAIDGVGPIRAARESANAKLVATQGDVEKAVAALVKQHVRLAAAQGFVTNLGGGAALAVAIPANIAGVALVQCHLVAGIAHLRGYDLDDPRVRNAILCVLLGRDTVQDLLKDKKLPTTPMALATSPVHDPALDDRVASEVTTELFGKVVGRRAATLVGRRIPLLGGGVGAATDGWSTREIGRYAQEELRDRRLHV